MEEKFTTERLPDMTVVMQTNEPIGKLAFRSGRACLDKDDKRMTFVETPKRGPRSIEVGRTPHSRFVRRPDGLYTLTVRFSPAEKFILAALQAEIRDVVKAAQYDHEVYKRREVKNEEKTVHGTGEEVAS